MHWNFGDASRMLSRTNGLKDERCDIYAPVPIFHGDINFFTLLHTFANQARLVLRLI